MGFSNKDRILTENLYILKCYGANNLLRNFLIKSEDCRDWINFWKATKS